MAHAVGVSVEGELGCLGSLETGQGAAEDGHGAEGALDRDQLLTDPAQARDFVAATGVDALAVAIGTSHGAYKFSRKPTGEILAMDVVRAIHAALPSDASGDARVEQRAAGIAGRVQRAWRRRCPQTWGVPVEEIQDGIRHGVRKVNIDTDCRLAMAGQFRRVAHEQPVGIRSPRLPQARDGGAEALCAERFEQFGTAGQAPRLRPMPLSEMATRYRSGALAPTLGTAAEAA